jgi:tetratricopeptide (TPR) repeat protein
MTNSKTVAAPGRRQRGPRASGQNKLDKPKIENVDEAIERAQQGRVNVTPEKAIEMAGKLYAEGKLGPAAKVCEQVIQARPSNADAHNIFGAILQALGKKEDAIQALRRAVDLAPQASSVRANLGEVLRQSGKLEQAAEALEEAVRLDPQNAQALNNLGIVYFEKRDIKRAIEFYRQAIEIRPEMAEAYNNLANASRLAGDNDAAIDAYQNALLYRERYPEAYNNLGTLLQLQNRIDEAEHALRKAIAQNPRYIDARNNLASLLSAQKKDVDALRVLGEALKIEPKNVQTLLITARIQLRRGNLVASEQGARAALVEQADNAEALTILGQVLHETDRYEEALEVLERAVQANPNNPEALNFYGVALKSVGRLGEAREQMLEALRKNGSILGAYANVSDLIDFSKGEGEELFSRMTEIFESAENPDADPYLPLHFAYGKALEDRGEYKAALNHYIVGGRMKRAQLSYNEAETFEFFDAIREAFPKKVFKDHPYKGLQDDRPVFIVGMPRSGSTLVEQILASHPDIYGAGEVKYLSQALGQIRDRFPSLPKFPQMMGKIGAAQLDIIAKKYLSALTGGSGSAKRVTDKLLTNYFFVGLLHLLYPNARFINTVRNPIDTCLSGFTKLFKDDMPHSYNLEELGRYYGKYRQLMEHWQKVLPKGVLKAVQYEDVVADTEKEARALIDFIGLEWDQVCVDFHKSDRPVKTASVAQVRRPIFNTSLKRWEKYGDGLQPLIDAIESKEGAAA